jgi:hypothetical protein
MLLREPFRLAARVEMHLPGGWTRIIFFAITHGDIRNDIPTEAIPLHLRPIRSEFLVIMPRFSVEPTDSIEEIRNMCRQVQVEELNPGS